jgi:hypothetical protein
MLDVLLQPLWLLILFTHSINPAPNSLSTTEGSPFSLAPSAKAPEIVSSGIFHYSCITNSSKHNIYAHFVCFYKAPTSTNSESSTTNSSGAASVVPNSTTEPSAASIPIISTNGKLF